MWMEEVIFSTQLGRIACWCQTFMQTMHGNYLNVSEPDESCFSPNLSYMLCLVREPLGSHSNSHFTLFSTCWIKKIVFFFSILTLVVFKNKWLLINTCFKKKSLNLDGTPYKSVFLSLQSSLQRSWMQLYFRFIAIMLKKKPISRCLGIIVLHILCWDWFQISTEMSEFNKLTTAWTRSTGKTCVIRLECKKASFIWFCVYKKIKENRTK